MRTNLYYICNLFMLALYNIFIRSKVLLLTFTMQPVKNSTNAKTFS